MQRAIAILLAKLAGAISRRMQRGGGTALPGLVAENLAPNLLGYLLAQVPAGTVFITGTNGKTTTAALHRNILAADGRDVLHNATGSNLTRGVLSMLLEKAGWNGTLALSAKSVAVLELDEAAIVQALKQHQPSCIVVTNLFRDQLDRYGEVQTIAAGLRSAFTALGPSTTLLLNGDDPLVASLGADVAGPVRYFGLDDVAHARDDIEMAADSHYCPQDSTPLTYATAFYGHLGQYACDTCGWKRPERQVRATQIELRGFAGAAMSVSLPEQDLSLRLRVPGLYNVYNALAAVAAAWHFGTGAEALTQGLQATSSAFGRAEAVKIQERQAWLLLIKNPVGANQVLRLLAAEDGPAHVLAILEDRAADGHDVSWIWDVDFEDVAEACVTTGGHRAEDMAVRLKYAGMRLPEVNPSVADAFDRALAAVPPGGTLFILATYTGMLDMRKVWAARGYVQRYWESQA
jgi:UDP-N-acetylmuramyl tripeptide synthase